MKDIISHKIHRIHGHKKEHHHVMLFLVIFHSLNVHQAKASQFSTEFSVLSRHCRLESAHAWHNSSELDSALAYSQISVFRFQFSVYRVSGVSGVGSSSFLLLPVCAAMLEYVAMTPFREVMKEVISSVGWMRA